MERLQISVSALQKNNMELEAENLDLKLDSEKANTNVCQLNKKIHNLER